MPSDVHVHEFTPNEALFRVYACHLETPESLLLERASVLLEPALVPALVQPSSLSTRGSKPRYFERKQAVRV
jgi:hypothetical protein